MITLVLLAVATLLTFWSHVLHRARTRRWQAKAVEARDDAITLAQYCRDQEMTLSSQRELIHRLQLHIGNQARTWN